MGLRWHGMSVNATDPARLARWWAEVLGVRVVYEKPDLVALPGLVFVRSQPHVDLSARPHLALDSDDVTADVERLLDMGARHVDQMNGERVTLADPEGNPFSLLPPGYSS